MFKVFIYGTSAYLSLGCPSVVVRTRDVVLWRW